VLHIADLDHCFNVEQVIRETFRVLKPGGKTVILLENRGRFSNDIKKLLGREISHGIEHLYYFDMNDICALVKPYGRIEFMRSYGFLLGFDFIGRFLPKALIKGLSAACDRVLGSLFAKKGQHFVLSVSKPMHGEVSPLGFLCPHCGEEFNWGVHRCDSCRKEIKKTREDTLDALTAELG
jgi:predicted RNA-binding Zn-ribbon protein involved in translation (DUF1610 family)